MINSPIYSTNIPEIYHFQEKTLLCLLYTYHIWATSQENLSLGVYDQVRLKPACSATS